MLQEKEILYFDEPDNVTNHVQYSVCRPPPLAENHSHSKKTASVNPQTSFSSLSAASTSFFDSESEDLALAKRLQEREEVIHCRSTLKYI